MVQAERHQVVDGKRMLVQVQGAAAFHWSDTLVMDARSLAPQTEALHLGPRTIHLTYDGNRITRVEQAGDSAARTSTSTHPQIPFGFNQLDLLMRAVPLRVGYRAILPLYSEATDVLEMDTLEVVGAPSGGARSWMLRFADPAIVARVGLDGGTREIVTYESQSRTSSGTSRRVPMP
jgi:hypothetical protein